MDEGNVRDTARRIGETAENLASQAQSSARDALDQGKTMFQNAKAGAADAVDRAAAVARDVSAAGTKAGAQAGGVIQGFAREVGNQAGQVASVLYQQGTNARGYLSRYAAEQPLTALLLAAAVGYGLAYLIHRS